MVRLETCRFIAVQRDFKSVRTTQGTESNEINR